MTFAFSWIIYITAIFFCSFSIQLQHNYNQYIISAGFLATSLSSSAIMIPLMGFKVPRMYGVYLILLYIAYLTTSIVAQIKHFWCCNSILQQTKVYKIRYLKCHLRAKSQAWQWDQTNLKFSLLSRFGQTYHWFAYFLGIDWSIWIVLIYWNSLLEWTGMTGQVW